MITIVTDSSAYMKKSEARELGVRLVPIGYVVSGRSFFESYSDHNGDYENLVKSNSDFSTSQPNLAAFLSCFEEELAKGNEVLCVTISSRLSGTYSTAHMAARQTGSERVTVFDSHLTAGGLYLLIKRVARLVKTGLSQPEIMQTLPEIRDKITTAFTVGDMAPLRKSGRIGFVRMGVETILNRKPILLLYEGVVVSDSIACGNADIIKKLTRLVTADAKEFVVNYIGNNRLATNLYNVLKTAHPSVPISLSKMGPVLGIHLGLNVVALSFTTYL